MRFRSATVALLMVWRLSMYADAGNGEMQALDFTHYSTKAACMAAGRKWAAEIRAQQAAEAAHYAAENPYEEPGADYGTPPSYNCVQAKEQQKSQPAGTGAFHSEAQAQTVAPKH